MFANKKKIINDPLYGFIQINNDLLFDLIEHPYFQRLRRIKQLGLTSLVYPGANHTRFQHALGAFHLLTQAIEIIRSKGHEISPEEATAAGIAILLHDIGHGPFSHALELSIIEKLNHEQLSMLFIKALNKEFKNQLNLAQQIFQDKYHKKFLNQLISSQLDMDRMDYLKRDSFFTGVHEGIIGTDRLIKMLNVRNDELVIEAKGIYSVEKFLIARRLMYWQVYLHKTVISAEYLLIKILQRARELTEQGENLKTPSNLHYFLKETLREDSVDERLLQRFAWLDDSDIIMAAKTWIEHRDKTLSFLCNSLINRKLFKVDILNKPLREADIEPIKQKVKERYQTTEDTLDYFVFTGIASNYAYMKEDENIKILLKNENVIDISGASDIINTAVVTRQIDKFFLCYPKDCSV